MTHQKTNELTSVNVLIIDDHKMIRDGLRVMLASLYKSLNFKVVEAESGEEGMKKLRAHPIDLVIVDYQMPGWSGAETIHRILRFKPETKILALSNYDEVQCIQNMLDAGAKGYVLKNIGPAELLNAIKAMLEGRAYYCSDVAVKLIDAGSDKNIKDAKVKKLLTSREVQVLQMIAMEMTNDEIAQKLFVAKRTVDTHRQNLINKLQVKNTVGLVKVAYSMNLVNDITL